MRRRPDEQLEAALDADLDTLRTSFMSDPFGLFYDLQDLWYLFSSS